MHIRVGGEADAGEAELPLDNSDGVKQLPELSILRRSLTAGRNTPVLANRCIIALLSGAEVFLEYYKTKDCRVMTLEQMIATI